MLSVIIVSWNGLRQLPSCLAALRPQLPSGSEIILVDNGSTDGTAAWAAEQPDITLVALKSNTGFAGGAATGLRVARGELLLLLNDDAFVQPGCIAALLDAAAANFAVGAFAGVLTFDHRPELVASAGIRMLRNGLALDRWPGRALRDLPAAPVPVFGASGGLALLRRALLTDIGLVEPNFFAYLEDADLAWRARLRGWRTLLVPTAVARHIYSATGGQGSPLKQRLLARNRLRLLVRCLPAALLWRYGAQILLYDALALLYGALRGQRGTVTGRFEALAELPQLRQQRRAIQMSASATPRTLARWLEPAGWPWQTLAEQRALDAILAERKSQEST